MPHVSRAVEVVARLQCTPVLGITKEQEQLDFTCTCPYPFLVLGLNEELLVERNVVRLHDQYQPHSDEGN